MPLVTSGVEHGNLRELALARMNDLGTKASLYNLLTAYSSVVSTPCSVEMYVPEKLAFKKFTTKSNLMKYNKSTYY